MDRAQRIVIILLNTTLVVDLISYLWKNTSVVGEPLTLVSGGLGLVGLILAVANQPPARWVTLAAMLTAAVWALVR